MSIRRFIEDRQPLPEELRGGIQQAREALGDPAQLARVQAAVQRRVGGAGGGSLPPPLAGGGAAWPRAHWLMLVGASLGVLLSALWLGPGRGESPSSLPPPAAAEASEPSGPSYLVLGRASLPEPELLAAPTDAGAPARAARARAEPRAPVAPAALDPQGELEILRQAQATLRSRPSASLDHVQLHQARYPAGVFAQEREVIRIDALFALQRDGEARDRAREFLAQFGNSTHAPRMRSLLGAP